MTAKYPSITYKADLRYYVHALLSREFEPLIDRRISDLSMDHLEALCALDGVIPPVPAGYRNTRA